MAYAKSEDLTLACRLGFIPTENRRYGSRFHKGSRVIWSTADGWISADLLDGSYQNHQEHVTLPEALERPLVEATAEAA